MMAEDRKHSTEGLSRSSASEEKTEELQDETEETERKHPKTWKESEKK